MFKISSYFYTNIKLRDLGFTRAGRIVEESVLASFTGPSTEIMVALTLARLDITQLWWRSRRLTFTS